MTLCILAEGGTFFECPRWHDGLWWVSDFGRKSVLSISPAGAQRIEMRMEEDEPAGLGFLPDESLLVASQHKEQIVRRTPDGTTAVHADLSSLPIRHLNDMVVDDKGNAYVGSWGARLNEGESMKTARLVLVRPDGSMQIVGTPLQFPNGAVISADGRFLIVGETMGGGYTQFSIEADGTLSSPQSWAQIGAKPAIGPDTTAPQLAKILEFQPDGCCLDADGAIWSADLSSKSCCRLVGGRVVERISLPPPMVPYACMLGGPTGKTLLICASRAMPHMAVPGDAILYCVDVEHPHAGWP